MLPELCQAIFPGPTDVVGLTGFDVFLVRDNREVMAYGVAGATIQAPDVDKSGDF